MLNAMIEISRSGDRDERRDPNDPRIPVDQISTLRSPDGEPMSIKVENFSARGFRFHVRGRDLEPGTMVSVGLAGAGAQQAAIVWRDGASYGCQFTEPLTRDRMAQAFTHAKVTRGRFVRTGRDGPGVAKWPGSVRLAVLLSGAIGSWALFYVVARVVLQAI